MFKCLMKSDLIFGMLSFQHLFVHNHYLPVFFSNFLLVKVLAGMQL